MRLLLRQVCLAQLIDTCERLHPNEFRSLAPKTWWVGKEEAKRKPKWPEQLDRHRQYCEAGGGGDRARAERAHSVSASARTHTHAQLGGTSGACLQGTHARAGVQTRERGVAM